MQEQLQSRVVELRRELHQIAELSFQEVKTSEYLQKKLDALGVNWKLCAKTGLIAVLREDLPGPALMIRADMDALPIQEQNKFDYVSKHEGVMHACGHDAHMGIAMTTLEWLKPLESSLKKPVKFVFQPAEELYGGARVMVKEGALESPEVDEVYGLHIANRLPSRKVGVKDGIFSAYCDQFKITIHGKGGHGARPYQCIEPIMIATRLINDSQQIVAREIYAMKHNVLTFTTIQSGQAYNVIDDICTLGGTFRSQCPQDREYVIERLLQKFRCLETEFSCKIEWELIEGYPAIHNNTECAQVVEDAAREVLGDEGILRDCMGMGGEDVSYFLEKVPGCYFLLGVGEDHCKFEPHHSPRFDFDETALIDGVRIFQKVIQTRAMKAS